MAYNMILIEYMRTYVFTSSYIWGDDCMLLVRCNESKQTCMQKQPDLPSSETKPRCSTCEGLDDQCV